MKRGIVTKYEAEREEEKKKKNGGKKEWRKEIKEAGFLVASHACSELVYSLELG